MYDGEYGFSRGWVEVGGCSYDSLDIHTGGTRIVKIWVIMRGLDDTIT